MGDVNEDAMMEPGPGKRSLRCFARDLRHYCQIHVLFLSKCSTADIPSLHSINLEVNPPDARDTQNTPQRSLLSERSNGKPLENQEICQRDDKQQRESKAEEEYMER